MERKWRMDEGMENLERNMEGKKEWKWKKAIATVINQRSGCNSC